MFILSKLKVIGLGIVAGGVGLLALLYRMRGKKLRQWQDVAAVGKERKRHIEQTSEQIDEATEDEVKASRRRLGG